MCPHHQIAAQLRAEVDGARAEYLRASSEFLKATRERDYLSPPDGLLLMKFSAHIRHESFLRYREAVKRLTEFVLDGGVKETGPE
jgi:hypothetical protein